MVRLTSRVSVGVVQKAAVMDVPVLIAVSAPTRRPGRSLGRERLLKDWERWT
jgi:FdhD/NarQ family